MPKYVIQLCSTALGWVKAAEEADALDDYDSAKIYLAAALGHTLVHEKKRCPHRPLELSVERVELALEATFEAIREGTLTEIKVEGGSEAAARVVEDMIDSGEALSPGVFKYRNLYEERN
jgi:hypothetical protein